MAGLVCLALPAFGQFAHVEGNINGPDGKGVAGAVVGFDKLDTRRHSEAKTDKKGHYYMYPLQPGVYSVTVTVDGKLRERKDLHHVTPGKQEVPLTFKLRPEGDAPAIANVLKSEAQVAAVNEAFLAGKEALVRGQYDQAIASLNKAAAAEPRQAAIWSLLADAYLGAGDHQKAQETFRKAVEISPANGEIYNSFALTLAATGKLEEAKHLFAKAAEVDPAGAGKYHYNLGALLLDAGQVDAAAGAFKSAIDADKNHAEAHYQYGVAQMRKATRDAGGRTIAPPGTLEALRRYLALAPEGPNAQSARETIAILTR